MASVLPQQLYQNLQTYFATQPVRKVFVFGSFARNEQTDASDLDLLVEFDPQASIGMEFIQMYLDLKDLTGREIDLLTEKSISKYVREAVDREKILIYEKQAA